MERPSAQIHSMESSIRFFMSGVGLCCLGISFIKVWFCNAPYQQQVMGDASVGFMLCLLARALAPLLVVLAFRGKDISERTRSIMDIVAVCVMVVGGFCIAFDFPFLDSATSLVLLGFGSAAAGWAYVSWGDIYAHLRMPETTVLVFLSLSVSSGCNLILVFLPDVVVALCMVACPIVAFIMMRKAAKGLSEVPDLIAASAPSCNYDGKIRRLFGAWFAALCLFALVWGGLQALPFGEPLGLPYLVLYRVSAMVLSLAPIVWTVFLKRKLSTNYLWLLTIPIICFALLLVLLGDSDASQLANTLLSCAYYMVFGFVWLQLTSISQHVSRPPYVIYSLGWGFAFLPMALGEIAVLVFLTYEHSSTTLIVILLVLLAVSMLFLVAPRTSNVDTWRNETPSERKRGALLGEEWGLTVRELQVVKLIGQGRTQEYCAQELSVSINTIRGHMKRIYTKLDIHSKAELIDILEGELDAG
ncbi:MAG: helix-turn-helix transcriptional regulator [Gordonibacter sp.]|uniref:helix-turn-helix transcriptional regulator n=2 Tax=Gordonibacter sp. TaxID=1968902 RepID=UPI002FC7F1E8